MYLTNQEYTTNVACSYDIVIPKGTPVRFHECPTNHNADMYVVQCPKCLAQMSSHDRKYRFLTVPAEVVDTKTKF